MNKPTIGLFGGAGFVGSTLANRLAQEGISLRIFTRDREHARHLWLLPDTAVIAVDLADHERLTAAVDGCTAVVNLIGILNERGDTGAGFKRVHVDTVSRLIKACKSADVPQLLHFSALKADIAAPSHYLRSKGEAEKLLLAENGRRLRVNIVRPSVIFGAHDDFLNRFARMLSFAPRVLALPAAEAKLQPVYIHDVVAACVKLLSGTAGLATSHDLGGPAVLSLREIVSYVAAVIERPTTIVGLGPGWSGVLARLLEMAPGTPLSRDNLRSLTVDSVITGTNGLTTLGITATPLAEVVPQYLGGRFVRDRYNRFRRAAGRER